MLLVQVLVLDPVLLLVLVLVLVLILFHVLVLVSGLTDVCHVDAVLGGAVVAQSGDGRHVHAVDFPDGGVAGVEVAAVEPLAHVVRALMGRTLTVGPDRDRKWVKIQNTREEVLITQIGNSNVINQG